MATLLGPDGRPIDLAKLKEEQAGPTLTGVRQVIGDHPAQGLTPRRLASLLLEAEQGDATRYLELAEEMEEKDLHYLGVMQTRKRAIAQLDITVEPASDAAEDVKNAELVEAFLDRDELEDELFDVLDAVGKGYSVTEIVWDVSERQWLPRRLEWRFPQWFEFDRRDGKTLRLRGEAGPEELAPFKFIQHVHKAKSGLPIRGGLARAAAWGYLFKNYDLKDWIAFIEIYGQPLRVGRYHAGATADDKKVLLKAVANIGSDAAAIIPDSMMLEFVRSEAARETGVLYKDFAEYVDKQLSKAVLGQTLTTEVSEGSRAAATVHGEVREDIEKADCKQVCAALNRDVTRPIVDLNRGPQKAYPAIRIGRPESTDIVKVSDAVSKLVPVGLKLGQRQTRQLLGFEDPDEDDELLGRAAPREETPGAPPAPPGSPPPDAAAVAQRRRPRRRDEVDAVVAQLAQQGAGELEGLVDRVRSAVEEAEDLEDLTERLTVIAKQLKILDLADLIAQGLLLAELAGRDDILSEAQEGDG